MSKIKKMLMDLQKFADGEGEGQDPAPTPKASQSTQQQPKPEGKVFSEEYVKSLREEAADNRIQKRELEKTVIETLGLEADSLDAETLKSFVDSIKKQQEQIISKANERLIRAEIRSLEGYDSKLVERLIDKSKVKITEDGEVEGLEELIEELEEEFPQIKVTNSTSNAGANPSTGADGLTEKQKLVKEYEAAEERGDFITKMALMEKIQKLEK